jgi:hypothetical protein
VFFHYGKGPVNILFIKDKGEFGVSRKDWRLSMGDYEKAPNFDIIDSV